MRFHVILLAVILFAVSSCERLNPDVYFKETASGRNVLSFTLNGEKVYQSISGGFPSEYPLTRHATFREDPDTGSIVVEASLHHKCFSWLSFSVPADGVADGAALQADVVFEYLYLPRIAHWGEPEVTPSYSSTPLVIDREAEYRHVTVTNSTLKIRRWSREQKILAGNFTLQGQYADSTGKVIPFNVTDGMFDVTDDTYPLSYN